MQLNLENESFKSIANPGAFISGCVYLLKRQTINSNRAICVIRSSSLPKNMDSYLRTVRANAAFKIGFFPFFWGLGLQIVLVCPGAPSLEENGSRFVAKVDNQWAITNRLSYCRHLTRAQPEHPPTALANSLRAACSGNWLRPS